MLGGTCETRQFQLPLERDFSRRNGRREQYHPGVITPQGAIAPAEFHGSAHLAALIDTDGFFVVPKDIVEIAAGQKVSFLPIGRGW